MIDRNIPPVVSRQLDNLCMVTSVMQLEIIQCKQKFEGKIFLWVQLSHKNITQRINFTTKLSWMNISQTTVCIVYFTVMDTQISSWVWHKHINTLKRTFHFSLKKTLYFILQKVLIINLALCIPWWATLHWFRFFASVHFRITWKGLGLNILLEYSRSIS